jgi:aminocarboxymuconate-semialdehyde decarboxylase
MHSHINPKDFPPAGNRPSANRWPFMEHFEPGRARVMINGENFRTITSANWDVEARLKEMEDQGVDAEAISPMPELLSYWFTPEDGLDFSRATNEYIRSMCETAPGRFFGLGMVPLQSPDLAAKELSNVKSMGLAGIELGSNILGRSLGMPEFQDFFMEADRLGVAVFVHALHPTFTDRFPNASLTGSIGFPTDTALTIASLMAGGTAEKCPTLRIAFSHGGGSFPFMLPRYGGTWNEEPREQGGEGGGRGGLPHTPYEYARRFYYDSLLFDRRAVRYLIDMMGHKQVLVGTDYPFGVREKHADDTLRSMNLPQDVYEDITWNNTFRFLGVEAPVLASTR